MVTNLRNLTVNLKRSKLMKNTISPTKMKQRSSLYQLSRTKLTNRSIVEIKEKNKPEDFLAELRKERLELENLLNLFKSLCLFENESFLSSLSTYEALSDEICKVITKLLVKKDKPKNNTETRFVIEILETKTVFLEKGFSSLGLEALQEQSLFRSTVGSFLCFLKFLFQDFVCTQEGTDKLTSFYNRGLRVKFALEVLAADKHSVRSLSVRNLLYEVADIFPFPKVSDKVIRELFAIYISYVKTKQFRKNKMLNFAKLEIRDVLDFLLKEEFSEKNFRKPFVVLALFIRNKKESVQVFAELLIVATTNLMLSSESSSIKNSLLSFFVEINRFCAELFGSSEKIVFCSLALINKFIDAKRINVKKTLKLINHFLERQVFFANKAQLSVLEVVFSSLLLFDKHEQLSFTVQSLLAFLECCLKINYTPKDLFSVLFEIYFSTTSRKLRATLLLCIFYNIRLVQTFADEKLGVWLKLVSKEKEFKFILEKATASYFIKEMDSSELFAFAVQLANKKTNRVISFLFAKEPLKTALSDCLERECLPELILFVFFQTGVLLPASLGKILSSFKTGLLKNTENTHFAFKLVSKVINPFCCNNELKTLCKQVDFILDCSGFFDFLSLAKFAVALASVLAYRHKSTYKNEILENLRKRSGKLSYATMFFFFVKKFALSEENVAFCERLLSDHDSLYLYLFFVYCFPVKQTIIARHISKIEFGIMQLGKDDSSETVTMLKLAYKLIQSRKLFVSASLLVPSLFGLAARLLEHFTIHCADQHYLAENALALVSLCWKQSYVFPESFFSSLIFFSLFGNYGLKTLAEETISVFVRKNNAGERIFKEKLLCFPVFLVAKGSERIVLALDVLSKRFSSRFTKDSEFLVSVMEKQLSVFLGNWLEKGKELDDKVIMFSALLFSGDFFAQTKTELEQLEEAVKRPFQSYADELATALNEENGYEKEKTVLALFAQIIESIEEKTFCKKWEILRDSVLNTFHKLQLNTFETKNNLEKFRDIFDINVSIG